MIIDSAVQLNIESSIFSNKERQIQNADYKIKIYWISSKTYSSEDDYTRYAISLTSFVF